MTPQETEVWNLVHNWCDGLQADIPDMAKRALMDTILERDREIAMDSWYEAKSFGPHSFDTYWRSLTEKEG